MISAEVFRIRCGISNRTLSHGLSHTSATLRPQVASRASNPASLNRFSKRASALTIQNTAATTRNKSSQSYSQSLDVLRAMQNWAEEGPIDDLGPDSQFIEYMVARERMSEIECRTQVHRIKLLLGIADDQRVDMAPKDLASLAAAAGRQPETIHRRILELRGLLPRMDLLKLVERAPRLLLFSEADWRDLVERDVRWCQAHEDEVNSDDLLAIISNSPARAYIRHIGSIIDQNAALSKYSKKT